MSPPAMPFLPLRRVLRAAAMAWLVLAGSAQANGWVGYGESESGTFYFDPASVQSKGQRHRVWRLFELKQPRADGVQSGKAWIEFDCQASTYRYLRTLYFAGRQGQGKYLGGAQAQPEEPIGPGSMIGLLSQKICPR